jgi:hypothetical protein
MKLIPTKIHGFIDYMAAILQIVIPLFYSYPNNLVVNRVPFVLGVIILVYSLMTKYELGFVKLISMKTHIRLDILSGTVLALSPWLFRFADEIWVPFAITGLIEICIAIITQTTPRRIESFKKHERFPSTYQSNDGF